MSACAHLGAHHTGSSGDKSAMRKNRVEQLTALTCCGGFMHQKVEAGRDNRGDADAGVSILSHALSQTHASSTAHVCKYMFCKIY